MPPASSEPAWRGSLERLRRAGCPSLEPVLASHMPRKATLVLDHNAINDVVAATMEALTGAGYDNLLIVPELALDFFDKDAKTSSQVAFNYRGSESSAAAAPTSGTSGTSAASAVESPLRPKEFINYDKLQIKKEVLLSKDTFRIRVQRVEQYDEELLKALEIKANAFDTRLYVVCAVYFQKAEKRPTVIITTDPVVMELAKKYGILTCPAEDICNCGVLIDEMQAKEKDTHKGVHAAPPQTTQPKASRQNPTSLSSATAKAKAKSGASPAPQKANKKGHKR